MKDKFKNILYYLIPLVILAISSICIFNDYIWADEAYSLVVANKSFENLIKSLLLDMHPPLYFSLLKVFITAFSPIFGNNQIIAGKFLSFIPIILITITSFTLVKELYGKTVSFLFALFMVSMPEMIIYAVEIRMYTWAILFVTLAFLYSIKIIRQNNKTDWIYLTVFTILSTFTHYFSCLTSVFMYFVFMIYIFVFDRKLIKRFFVSVLFICLTFGPWIVLQLSKLISGGMVESFWITKPTLVDILNFIKFPFSVMNYHFISYILMLVTVVLAATMFIKLVQNRKDSLNNEAIYSFSVIVLLVLFSTVVSLLIKPVFVRRYMMPAFGCFWLSIAIIIRNNIHNKTLRSSIIALYIVSGLIVNYERIELEDFYNTEINKMYSMIDSLNTKDFNIVTDNQNILQPILYFYPSNNIYFVGDLQLALLYENVYKSDYLKFIDNMDAVDSNTTLLMLKNKSFLEENNIKNAKYIGNYYLDNVGDVEMYSIENK